MVRRLIAVSLLGVLAGCNHTYRPPVSIAPDVTHLQVRERSAGTQHACLRVGDVLWATDGRQIQVLDRRGRVLRTLELGEPGVNAPIVAMALQGDQVHAVLEDEAVCTIDASDPQHPVVEGLVDARRLGMAPRRIGVIDDRAVAWGPEGAVAIDARERLVRDVHVASMVDAPGGGWYVEGRRLRRVDGGGYIGTASLVTASPTGVCAFARNEGGGALLGVLDADAREAAPEDLTVAVPGPVRSMRFDGDDLLVVSHVGVHGWTLIDGALRSLGEWRQPGLRDAAMTPSGDVLAVGEHGRSVVALTFNGGEERHRHEAPGGLGAVHCEEGAMVAKGAAGLWLFQPGYPARRHNGIFQPHAPVMRMDTNDWLIRIDAAGVAHIENPLGATTLEAPNGGRFNCLAGTARAMWLGHDHGIMRLTPPDEPLVLPEATDEDVVDTVDPLQGTSIMSVRLGGPVLTMNPLVLGRGVAYATAHDGFGMVVERVSERLYEIERQPAP